MYPHRIRLRGPWTCQPLSPNGEPQGDPIRFKLPYQREAELPHRVRFTRAFGYPGRIDEFERVWLIFEGWQGVVSIQLNGKAIHQDDLQVTSILRNHNSLEVELADDADASWQTGETALEIRCAAYLRDVEANCKSNELRVSGRVVGSCHRPLDLYLLRNGKNEGYLETSAFNGERRFEFAIPDCVIGPNQSDTIRLELVNASVVWYAVEATVDSQTM